MADRDLVTVNEACALVMVSRKTIYTWIKLGKVETTKIPSGRMRIFKDTLFQQSDLAINH